MHNTNYGYTKAYAISDYVVTTIRQSSKLLLPFGESCLFKKLLTLITCVLVHQTKKILHICIGEKYLSW